MPRYLGTVNFFLFGTVNAPTQSMCAGKQQKGDKQKMNKIEKRKHACLFLTERADVHWWAKTSLPDPESSYAVQGVDRVAIYDDLEPFLEDVLALGRYGVNFDMSRTNGCYELRIHFTLSEMEADEDLCGEIPVEERL